MNRRIKNVHIVLILVLILQIINMIWWGNAKKGYHIDEMSTFHLANGFSEIRYQVTHETDYTNRWHEEPKSYLIDWMTVQEDERFDFQGVRIVNSRDNHPPLFYYPIHALASLFPDTFSKWFGIIPNIGYFVFSQILLYLIFSGISRSGWSGIAAVIAYGFSAAAISMTIYIRMYALMTLFSLAAFYVHIRLMEDQKTAKWMVLSGAISCFGVLTHYYFLVYQFFMSAFCVCRYAVRRQWKHAARYAAVIFSGLGAAMAYYPWIVEHLLSSKRGVEAVSNFMSDQNRVSEYITLMDNGVFNGYGKVIFLAAGVFFVTGMLLGWIRSAQKPERTGLPLPVVMGLFVGAAYVCVIAKAAPYVADRYIAPVFPLLMGMAVLAAIAFLRTFMKKESAAAAVAAAAALLLAIGSYASNQVKYLYPQLEQEEQTLNLYREYPAVVVHKDNWDDMSILFNLMQSSRYYSTSLNEMDTLEPVFADCGENAIVYLRKNNEQDENLKRIEELSGMKAKRLFQAYGRRFIAYTLSKPQTDAQE